MSIRIMIRVWDHAPQDGTALLALLALADYANDDGVAWPAVAHIAQRCRLSERQAQRLLTELESAGALYVQRGHGRGKRSKYIVRTGMTPDMLATALQSAPIGLSEIEAEKVTLDVTQRKGDIQGSKSDKKMTSRVRKGDIQGKNDGRLPPVGAPSGDPIRHIDPSIKNDPSDSHAVSRKPRARDLLLDEIAKVCYGSLDAFGAKGVAAKLAKAKKDLLAIKTDLTEDDVRALGQWWQTSDWRGKRGAKPFPHQLAEAWLLRQAEAAKAQPQPVIAGLLTPEMAKKQLKDAGLA